MLDTSVTIIVVAIFEALLGCVNIIPIFWTMNSPSALHSLEIFLLGCCLGLGFVVLPSGSRILPLGPPSRCTRLERAGIEYSICIFLIPHMGRPSSSPLNGAAGCPPRQPLCSLVDFGSGFLGTGITQRVGGDYLANVQGISIISPSDIIR